ncbi:MAG: class I SAM-dependent methyltransferase [Actinobacteria bacterium]|nr:MAG: class I SAM-dependent methyltransferase [Actinomycetota bacterium]
MATSKSNNYDKYTSKNPLAQIINNRFLDTLAQLAAGIKPQKIFDAGCGEGFVVKRLNGSVKAQITGLDLEDSALEYAKKINPGIDFHQGSVYELPFKDNEFDLVVLTEVLEHLDEPEKALKEITRVSSKYCLVSVPKEPVWRMANMARFRYLGGLGNTPGHINHWSKKAFLNLIKPYLNIKEIKTPFPWTVVLGEIRIKS